MKCSGRQPPKSLRNSLCRDRMRLRKTATRQPFRQKRGARNGCRAAAAQKPRLRDCAVFHSNGKFQNVPANGIRRLHLHRRVRQLARIARIPEMLQDQFTVHSDIVAQLSSRFSIPAKFRLWIAKSDNCRHTLVARNCKQVEHSDSVSSQLCHG